MIKLIFVYYKAKEGGGDSLTPCIQFGQVCLPLKAAFAILLLLANHWWMKRLGNTTLLGNTHTDRCNLRVKEHLWGNANTSWWNMKVIEHFWGNPNTSWWNVGNKTHLRKLEHFSMERVGNRTRLGKSEHFLMDHRTFLRKPEHCR